MAETTLKTRIKLLYKSYSEWSAIPSFTPLKGELCFCEVPASTGAVVDEPCLLFKVGDGTKTFSQLPWGSAKAADVYSWAKKENLDFNDLDATFLAALDERIAEKSSNTEYQITDAGNGVWKFQKREIGTESWEDVSTVNVAAYVTPLIQAEKERAEGAEGTLQSNIDAEVARAQAAEAKKVDKEITSTEGKAIIFNEADGGGAKFEHTDGTWSFAGVNNGGADGLAAQIYAVDSTNGYKGAKLDITKGGMYYTTGETSGLPVAQRDVSDNELVVKKDIKDLAGGMHFIGAVTQASGETIEAAIERVYTEAGKTYADRKAGDLVIIKTSESDREFVCDANKNWVELGDQGVYATKIQLSQERVDRLAGDATLQTNIDNEASARQTADATLQSNIDTEASTRATEDAKKVDIEKSGSNGTAYIFNETDGGGAKFENNSGVESFVGVHDGGTSSDGLAAQIYADKYVDGKWQGAKLDVTNNGMYYTVGNKSFAERAVSENEIAVKKNVNDEATARASADAALDAAKLNKLPNVDDPEDPGYGYPYHIPYDIGVTAGTDKIDLSVKTITLDNNLTKMSFAKELPSATQSTAGLMSSTDKAKLDHFYARDLTQESDDVLILNCNF